MYFASQRLGVVPPRSTTSFFRRKEQRQVPARGADGPNRPEQMMDPTCASKHESRVQSSKLQPSVCNRAASQKSCSLQGGGVRVRVVQRCRYLVIVKTGEARRWNKSGGKVFSQ